MKHLIHTIWGALVLSGLVSCMGIDNFDGPEAKISGTVIDKTTGKPMLLDHGVNHIRIWEVSYSLDPTPQDLVIKEDGTYTNNKLFSGTYNMLPRDGAWWPCDTTYNVAIGKKGTVQNFEVTPYLHVTDFTTRLDGTELTLSCKLQAPVTEGLPQITQVRAFINNNAHCGPGNQMNYYNTDANRVNVRKMWSAIGDADGNQTVEPFEITVSLKPGYTYWVRMGVQFNDTYSSWNLSEVVKIEVPSK